MELDPEDRWPTPTEWFMKVLALDLPERDAHIAHVLRDLQTAEACYVMNHRGRLEGLEHKKRELEETLANMCKDLGTESELVVLRKENQDMALRVAEAEAQLPQCNGRCLRTSDVLGPEDLGSTRIVGDPIARAHRSCPLHGDLEAVAWELDAALTKAENERDEQTKLANTEYWRAERAALKAARCPSCDHLTTDHRSDGCWYAVTTGTPGRDLVCPCTAHHPTDTTGETPHVGIIDPGEPDEGPWCEVCDEPFPCEESIPARPIEDVALPAPTEGDHDDR